MNLFNIFLRGTLPQKLDEGRYYYQNTARLQHTKNQNQANKTDKKKLLQKLKVKP